MAPLYRCRGQRRATARAASHHATRRGTSQAGIELALATARAPRAPETAAAARHAPAPSRLTKTRRRRLAVAVKLAEGLARRTLELKCKNAHTRIGRSMTNIAKGHTVDDISLSDANSLAFSLATSKSADASSDSAGALAEGSGRRATTFSRALSEEPNVGSKSRDTAEISGVISDSFEKRSTKYRNILRMEKNSR